jgi:hypothetical protein
MAVPVWDVSNGRDGVEWGMLLKTKVKLVASWLQGIPGDSGKLRTFIAK